MRSCWLSAAVALSVACSPASGGGSGVSTPTGPGSAADVADPVVEAESPAVDAAEPPEPPAEPPDVVEAEVVEPPVEAPVEPPPAEPLPLADDFDGFRLVPADLACAQDDDCVILPQPDCCGCGAMGVRTAIRSDRLARAERRLAEICRGVGCPQALSNHASCGAIPACVEQVCRLVPRGGRPRPPP